MSNVILNAVFQHSKAEGVARLVLLSLADRADDSGRAWCGAKDLCDRTRASRRQVKEVVPQLCEMGELAIVGKWGPKRCNVYQITLDQCDQRTSAATALVQSPPLTSAASAPKPSRTHKNSLRKLVGKPGPLKL